MAVISGVHAGCVNKLTVVLCLVVLIHSTQSINLGLIAGDLKRTGPGPLMVRKVSHHSPVIINVHPGLPKLPGIALPKLPCPKLPKSILAKLPPIPVPKLPAKPPPSLKSSKVKRSPLGRMFPLLPPLLPPVIPHLPILPILPPVIPPLLPLFPPPLLGVPRIPRLLPRLPPFGRLPRIGMSPLENTLALSRRLRRLRLGGPLSLI